MWPRVVSGCGNPPKLSSVGVGQRAVLGTRFSVSGIPDTAGHLGRAVNRMGALVVAQSALELKGGKSRGRWVVSKWARVLGPVSGWTTGRTSGGRLDGSLGESLSHCSSTVGLDKQRKSMVLELYCRIKQGEGEKVERERGRPWSHGERGEGRERRRARDERKKGESLKKSE